MEVPLRQHLLQPLELEIDDPHQVLPAELPEDDDVVDPVEELGPEVVPQLVPYSFLPPLPALGIELSSSIDDKLTAYVGGYNNLHVPEISHSALAIGEPP